MATLNARFSVYTGTKAKWATSSVILLKGEIGLETDTHLFKFGDGASAYSALPYANNISGEFGDLIADYYDKVEIDNLIDQLEEEISAIPKFKIQVVESLPASGNASTIYLVKMGTTPQQTCAEYIWINNAWEKLGDHNLDLSNYYTKSQVDSKINDAVTDIPASNITQDSTHRFVSDSEKSTWNNKQNKLTFDSAPTASSSNPVTSGGVKTALDSQNSNLTNLINTKTANVVKYTDSGIIINGGELA